MTARARLVLFAVAGLTLGALLVVAYNGLPAFGHYPGPYGDIITSAVVAERHATPAVGAIVFDYRGFDTLGEELILLAAAAGVGMLLRRQREEDEEDAPEDQSEGMRRPAPSDTVRFWGIALVAPLVVLGASLAAHGQLTPGGGFQGGVVLASALFLIYLANSEESLDESVPPLLPEPVEGLSALAFIAVAVIGLVRAGALLANVFPLGSAGSLLSGGTLPVLNAVVAVEVAAGIFVVVREELTQAVQIRDRWMVEE